nr:unnamed protein product [Digitaria exilis]
MSAPPSGGGALINEVLTDDELRAVLTHLGPEAERDAFGLVCRRWLRIQSSERRRLRARAGPDMLRRLAARFSGALELDLSQSPSRSFYPGVIDDDLDVIAGSFRNLRVLSLQNCKGISDVGVAKLGDGLLSLHTLDVSRCIKLSDKGCNSITDAGVSALADGCHHIKLLDISKCNKVGDPGVCKIAEASSSRLLSIKLLDCSKVGDESIFSLAKWCRNLDTLVIGGCRNISDASIKALALACYNSLRSLRMDWCLKLTDTSLRSLLSNCKHLVAIDVGCCGQITDIAFLDVEGNGFQSELKVLKISSCVQLTVAGVSSALKSFKALEYLDVRSCPLVTRDSCEQAGVQFPVGCKVNFYGSLLESDPSAERFF